MLPRGRVDEIGKETLSYQRRIGNYREGGQNQGIMYRIDYVFQRESLFKDIEVHETDGCEEGVMCRLQLLHLLYA